MQSVTLLVPGDAHQLGDVSVGYIIQPRDILHELIAVLDYHQPVPLDQGLLLELDHPPYPGVVAVGPLVGPAQHYCPVLAVAGIRVRKSIDELPSSYPLHIIYALKVEPQVIESLVGR